MPSFGEGFAKGLQGSLEQGQQGMLQLTLLSKKMEMEAKNRMAEMQQAHELNQIPGSQLTDIMKAVRTGSPLEGMLPEQLGQAALSAEGMGLRADAMMNKPQFIHSTDADGMIHVQAVSPLTGPIGNPTTVGLEPARTHAVNQATAAYGTIHSDLQQLGPQVQQLLTKYPDAAGIPLQQLQGWATSHGIPGAFDPAVKAFQDTMPQLGLTFGKMQIGSIRGWEMAKADIGALPNLSDSLDSANQKMALVDKRALNNYQASLVAYDPGNNLKIKLHPSNVGQEIGAQAADANQLHTTGKGVKYIVSQ